MSSPDVHTLTGAYALHALSEHEQRQFERHLAECPECARELAELRATAARLGAAVATRPPERLRQRVLAEIASIRQEAPGAGRAAGPSSLRGVSRWPLRLTAAAAAVFLVLAGVLGATALRSHDELNAARDQLSRTSAEYQPIVRLVAAPDVHMSAGTGVAGGTATALVSAHLNEIAIMASGLSTPPPGHVYQTWGIGPHGPRSIGLLPQVGSGAVSSLIGTDVNGADKIGVTVEPAGGSKMPTTNPVILFDMPTI